MNKVRDEIGGAKWKESIGADDDVSKKVMVQGREKYWKKLREDNGIRTFILRDVDAN